MYCIVLKQETINESRGDCMGTKYVCELNVGSSLDFLNIFWR